MKKTAWYDYAWIWSILFFSLGMYNILFAWLGIIDFLLPLFFAVFAGTKYYCNKLCGRAQLFTLIGRRFHLTRHPAAPPWLSSRVFRIGFLIFFMTMFVSVLLQTWLTVFEAASLRQTVTLFWSIPIPWEWAYAPGSTDPWIAQFAYGFYSIMLTSFTIGLALMAFYKPRTWCSFCPMGTLTQEICHIRAGSKEEK